MSETATPPPPSGEPSRLRPLVAKPASNRAVWIFAGCALLGGSVLFAALEGRRTTITTPAIAPGADDNASVGVGAAAGNATGGSVSPITIPPDPASNTMPSNGTLTAAAPIAVMTPRASTFTPARAEPPVRLAIAPSTPTPSYATPPMSLTPAAESPAPSTAKGPQVIYDAKRERPAINAGLAGEGNDPAKGSERVQAGRFSNPATTVPKGTVIQAVLESALDSTRPSLARAIISRDVVGFDGSKVLIARGSRLIGEYKADLNSGQSRAMIQWQRLMRPDGVIINLDSPSADPLGRAGVKGKVNTHFFAQFGGALLQSALNVGQQVGVNQLSNQLGNGTTVYAIPLSIGGNSAANQATNALPQTGKVAPTLTIKQGTSVSVFVARDLDFTGVE